MRINRFIAYCLGGLCIALPVFAYQLHIKWLGFPDGGLTALEQAEKTFYYVAVWPILALGLLFFYLGGVASKQDINKKLVIAFSMLILTLFVTIIIGGILPSYFNQGTGG